MDKQDVQNSPSDKKGLNKVKSHNSASSAALAKQKNEAAKKKLLMDNGAVKSLDLALGRPKRIKPATGECCLSDTSSPFCRDAPSDTLKDLRGPRTPISNIYSGMNVNNSSLMSMNFSHYELMRNVSRSNSTLEGTFSGTTSTTVPNTADASVRNERLEKYFRSAEMWSQKTRDREGSHAHNVHFEIPEK